MLCAAMSPHRQVVSVRHLEKRYGKLEALRGVDLDIEQGEVFALLGPNGAGKTTLVEILEGYRERSGGQVSVLGTDPQHGDERWRARLGMVLQFTTAFDQLSVEEIVAHVASFYPRPLDVARVIEMVGLGDKRKDRCSRLSGGQKRRVEVALGFVGDPELVFLDEPTTGLDPQGRHQLWDVVRGFTAQGRTILLTTHYLDEAEALADRVGVIIAGSLAEVAPPAELGGRERALVHVSFSRHERLAGGVLPEWQGTSVHGDVVTIQTDAPTKVVADLTAWARSLGQDEIPGLAVRRPSLEDVYLQMVESAERQAKAQAAGERTS
jgi:ABC-2 type transport system ATP-binding protein